MMTLKKYPVPNSPNFDIRLPRFAWLLSVELDAGSVVIWALVDVKQEAEWRRFRLLREGDEIENVPGASLFPVGAFKDQVGTVHLVEVR